MMNTFILLCIYFVKFFWLIEIVFSNSVLKKILGFPKNEPQEFCDSPKNNMQKCVCESAHTQKYIFCGEESLSFNKYSEGSLTKKEKKKKKASLSASLCGDDKDIRSNGCYNFIWHLVR